MHFFLGGGKGGEKPVLFYPVFTQILEPHRHAQNKIFSLFFDFCFKECRGKKKRLQEIFTNIYSRERMKDIRSLS